MTLVAGVVLTWCVTAGLLLEPVILDTLDWPFVARAGLLLMLIAPVSLALGLPFPLGLSQGRNRWVLPWGLGLERGIFGGGNAACQPDRA